MLENIHLKDLYTMEILSLACALVKAIDDYDAVKSRLTERPTPITDARTSALTVAHLAAMEFLEDDGGGTFPFTAPPSIRKTGREHRRPYPSRRQGCGPPTTGWTARTVPVRREQRGVQGRPFFHFPLTLPFPPFRLRRRLRKGRSHRWLFIRNNMHIFAAVSEAPGCGGCSSPELKRRDAISSAPAVSFFSVKRPVHISHGGPATVV